MYFKYIECALSALLFQSHSRS